MNINRYEIRRLTEEYGGQLGLNHAKRLLRLIAIIADNAIYNEDVVWVAAHLHTWGGFSMYSDEDTPENHLSIDYVQEYLGSSGCPEPFIEHVVECISSFHCTDAERSIEAVLVCDANMLDMLGVVGAVRMFVNSQHNLRLAYQLILQRRHSIPNKLTLNTSRVLARERVREMDILLQNFETDTFGVF